MAEAYVQIEKMTPDRTMTEYVTGYMWSTDEVTFKAYEDAKCRFEVPFEIADYLVDLFSEQCNMIDTFPMAELGYRTLTKQPKV